VKSLALFRRSHRRESPCCGRRSWRGARCRDGQGLHDYVETNSSWFKDPESAAALLTGLRPKGLHTLSFHQPLSQRTHPLCQNPGRQWTPRATPACRIFFPGWRNSSRSERLDSAHPHALSEFEERLRKRLRARYSGPLLDPHGRSGARDFPTGAAHETLEHILRENTTGCGRNSPTRATSTSIFSAITYQVCAPSGDCPGYVGRHSPKTSTLC